MRGPAGDKQIRFEALVRVADVFRRERQQNLPATPARKRAGKEVEQVEEGALTAAGDGDVLRPDRPPEFTLQQIRQRLNEPRVPLGRIVVGQHAVKGGAVGQEHLHALAQETLHARHNGGISAAQHAHLRIDRHRLAEVVHQLQDPAVGREFAPDQGKSRSASVGGPAWSAAGAGHVGSDYLASINSPKRCQLYRHLTPPFRV